MDRTSEVERWKAAAHQCEKRGRRHADGETVCPFGKRLAPGGERDEQEDAEVESSAVELEHGALGALRPARRCECQERECRQRSRRQQRESVLRRSRQDVESNGDEEEPPDHDCERVARRDSVGSVVESQRKDAACDGEAN